MADFADTVRQFTLTLQNKHLARFDAIADAAYMSIVEGSPVTGAPGQPVDTGQLKGSWQHLIDGPLSRRIVTKLDYAPVIEENPRGVTFRNHGPHSVKLTVSGWKRLVHAVMESA